jgi:hypothetical protein
MNFILISGLVEFLLYRYVHGSSKEGFMVKYKIDTYHSQEYAQHPCILCRYQT